MPAYKLSSRHGGHWKEHPKYESRDWRRLVWDGETRLGYWEWVETKAIDDAFDEDFKEGL